ncbi:MAG: protein-disulfide reductase DsbD domain-containing protein [Vicinamibacterales bacterium]
MTPVVETSPVRPGAAAELALKVKLPIDVHVQSDKPRDPNLIPTVLTLEAPAGVKVESITYPKASDLKQKSGGPPLAVFGSEFTINVKVSVAATIGEGDLTLPAKFRYQACNESLCFPPATATTQWTLKVQHVE